MPEDTTQQPATLPVGDNNMNVALPDPLSVATTATPPAGFSMPAPSADPSAAPTDNILDSSAPELPAPGFTMPTPSDPLAAPSEPIIPSSSFPTMTDTPAVVPASGDLATIKQQALEQLSPLVSHLDQTPEEKFRTTMMMIQASDNKDLVGAAYEAAQAIADDKVRAQALLDVINEINYFTQNEATTS